MEEEIKEEVISGEELTDGSGEDIATGVEVAGRPKEEELEEDKEEIESED